MSKSLGNSPDPLDVIGEYGADALRFTILYLAPSGQDVRFATEMCEIGRNFANKIWNAGRFLLMKRAEVAGEAGAHGSYPATLAELEPISTSDRWILSRFHSVLGDVEAALAGYRINEYTKLLYDFVWRDFCDWYVELLKTEISVSDDETRSRLMMSFALGLFDQVLRMLHPIVPFVTEELWQNIADRAVGDSISVASFPAADPTLVSAEVEREFALLQESVEAIRRMRNEANVPPSKLIDATVVATEQASYDMLTRSYELMLKLGRIDALKITSTPEKPKLSATEVVRGVEIHVHLEGLIDVEKERAKTGKEITRLEGQIRATEGKLSNEKFTANAPVDVVEAERTKLRTYQETIVKLRQTMEQYA
jgi:valyl-tRNA synthetase